MSRPDIPLHPEVLALVRNRPIVLAVSGGGDSMALLQIFWRLYRAGKLAGPLLVAHLNHQQRQPFADEAEALILREATQRDLPLVTRRFDTMVSSIRCPTGESEEAWLALYRHEYLATVAREFDTNSVILTGHQSDDHAESLLLGLMRGCSLGGLAYPVIKQWHGISVGAPLTLCRRSDLRTYLERQRVPYLEDPMNSDPHSNRSSVRMLLTELESRTGRDWTAPIARSAESIRQGAEALHQQASAMALNLSSDGALSVRDWRKVPAGLAVMVLEAYAEGQGMEPTGRQLHELERWLRTSPLNSARFVMGPEFIAMVYQGKLQIQAASLNQDESVIP